jgi:cadmium resistance protein CadD (predicted permease)
MKKILGLLGIIAVVGAVMAFFRHEEDDDEFLDEELP